MRLGAVLFPLLLVQAAAERPGRPIKQATRSGEVGRWTYEDFRETYIRSDELHRRRHPVNGASYVAEGHHFGLLQGQTAFRHRDQPLWLLHNFTCTQPTMTAEVPWDCQAIVFVLEGSVPIAPPPVAPGGLALVDAEREVRIEGDFEAIEPHPSLPIFAAMRYGCCDSPSRVSVHHLDGRTLCALREMRLESGLGWQGEPWQAIKADAKAVACLDGTRVPLAAPAIQPFAAFDDFRVTAEHQYGHRVELWRAEGELVGLLAVSQGLQGDTPVGVLEDVAHDAATGRLSFGARLSRGTHGCRWHHDVPSRDLYRFEGALKGDRLEGNLTYTDALHPGHQARRERLLLKKQRDAPSGFDSLPAWRQHVQWVLSTRGPKW